MKKVSELINLEGRKAIVTGGAGYIGQAICETLMELGADVCALDLDNHICWDTCEILNGMGFHGMAVPMHVDLSDEKQTRQSVTDSANKLGGLDIIIHCAGFVGTTEYPGWAVPLEEQTVDAWDAGLRVNLTSAFVIVQTALPFLKISEKASVIFISSIYGMLGPDNSIYKETDMATPAGYAASKGGLGQLSKYLSTVLAPNVRVNTITAGGVLRGQKDSFQKQYVKRTPLKRMAIEEDFKGSIAYLASDLSNYVTGTNIIVDGGWAAW